MWESRGSAGLNGGGDKANLGVQGDTFYSAKIVRAYNSLVLDRKAKFSNFDTWKYLIFPHVLLLWTLKGQATAPYCATPVWKGFTVTMPRP